MLNRKKTMSKSAVANCWTCCCNQKAKIAVHSNLMASWIEEAQHSTLFKDIAAISADYDITISVEAFKQF